MDEPESTSDNDCKAPLVLEYEPLIELHKTLPRQYGLMRDSVFYTCLDASPVHLALGSTKGLVVVYDLYTWHFRTFKDTKESVTVVKINEFVQGLAYGCSNGDIIVVLFSHIRDAETEVKRYIVHEADRITVSALEWDEGGERLFAGYTSGKLVQVDFQYEKGTCSASTLLNGGWNICQLSISHGTLLVSSLTCSLVMEVATGRLKQIGQAKRKEGPYGGCFGLHDIDPTQAYAARPGFRIWCASSEGEVQSTIKLKTAITSCESPPIMLLNEDITFPPPPDDVHFTLLYPWHSKYLVTFSQRYLWVLDPANVEIVGTHYHSREILAVCPCNDNIFFLTGDKLTVRKLSIRSDLQKYIHRAVLTSEMIHPVVPPHAEMPNTSAESQNQTDTTDTSIVSEPPKKQLTKASPGSPKTQATKSSLKELEDDLSRTKSVSSVDARPLALLAKDHQMKRFANFTEEEDFGSVVKQVKRKTKKKTTTSGSVSPSVSSQKSQSKSSVPSTPLSPVVKEYPTIDEIKTKTGKLSQVESPPASVKVESSAASVKAESSPTSVKIESSPASVKQVEDPPKVEKTLGHLENHESPTDSEQLKTKGGCNSPLSPVPEPQSSKKQVEKSLVLDDEIQEPLSTSASYLGPSSDLIPNVFVESGTTTVVPTESSLEVHPIGGSDVPQDQHQYMKDSTTLETPSEIQDVQTSSPISTDVIEETDSSQGVLQQIQAVSLPKAEDSLGDSDSHADNDEESDSLDKVSFADENWIPISLPHTRNQLSSLSASQEHLWTLDSKGTVWHRPLITVPGEPSPEWASDSSVSLLNLSVSHRGDLLWGTSSKGIVVKSLLPQKGKMVVKGWQGLEAKQKKIIPISIALGAHGAWVLCEKGQLLYRSEVSGSHPKGKAWNEVASSSDMVKLSCFGQALWAVVKGGNNLMVRTGFLNGPIGTDWQSMSAPCSVQHVSVTEEAVWIAGEDGRVFFRCGISVDNPCGFDPWWEVVVKSSDVDAEQHGIQRLLHLKTLFTSEDPCCVAAVANSGVWVLHNTGQILACMTSVCGSHYSHVTNDDLFGISTWNEVALEAVCGKRGVAWLVRDDGVLFACDMLGEVMKIDLQSPASAVASSKHATWVLTYDALFSREGFDKRHPIGTLWHKVDVSQLQERQIVSIALGQNCSWAVDDKGEPWFRFDVLAQDKESGFAQVWIPAQREGVSYPLVKIAMGSSPSYIWAIDTKSNIYVRKGSTADYPIGRSWTLVEGAKAKDLCISAHHVWALTPEGQVLCRDGVQPAKLEGRYWRSIPGRFNRISCSQGGEIWGITEESTVLKRSTHVLKLKFGSVSVTEDKSSFTETFMGESPVEIGQDWEMI